MTADSKDIYLDPENIRIFSGLFLRDLEILEEMIQEYLIESGKHRIGAEQELMLTDENYDPAPISEQVLANVDSDQFTTELGTYNLEINLSPHDFHPFALSEMEEEILNTLALLQSSLDAFNARPVLTGILPTLDENHIQEKYLTPKPRYRALDQGIKRLRGGRDYSFHIRGVDEIHINTDTVTIEAANTSFQVHFQVSPDDFARWYNIAQVVAGPVLAAAVNSPLLFNRRLWQETRIAIFQRSVDTRSEVPHQRQLPARVSFGNQWVEHSIVEIFKEDISRFRVLFAMEVNEDPREKIRNNVTPALEALQIFNSTIYRWNRPCYGISEGKPHFRIENRMLPAGPTPADEVANAAFWYGLIIGLADEYDDVQTLFRFEDVKNNFMGASRYGLDSSMIWLNQTTWSARDLILEKLLPLSEKGLSKIGVSRNDAERYLQIIQERVEKNQPGARWLLESMNKLESRRNSAESLHLLTKEMYRMQSENIPVHRWSLAAGAVSHQTGNISPELSKIMQQDFYTVHADELAKLALKKMQWNDVNYMLVEDTDHHLQGVISCENAERAIQDSSHESGSLSVGEVMETNLLTVSPTDPAQKAEELFSEHSLFCLPVIEDGQLVGLVQTKDF